MTTRYYEKQSDRGVHSAPITYYLLPITFRRGISLMEVLASVFVISIGLLGVLAVIPFGVFQVSKANHADYCANMLRNAGAEIRVRGLAQPRNWDGGNPVNSSGGTPVFSVGGGVAAGNELFNCSQFIMFDPFDTMGGDPTNIFKISANPGMWQEMMRGSDDLLYTIEEEGSRPAWTPSGSVTPLSSGKYTWFFTFKPEPLSNYTGNWAQVPISEVNPRVSVDVLACYNRSPGDPQKEQSAQIQPGTWNGLLSGATVTLASNVSIEGTKYIFVTWRNPTTSAAEGSWCRIVSRRVDPTTGNPTVTLVGSLPALVPLNPQAFIVDGVLYHTRIDNVPLFSN